MKKLLLALLLFTGVFFVDAQVKPEIRSEIRPMASQPRIVLKGDGLTDDTDALNAWGRGETVYHNGRILGNTLQNGTFLFSWKLHFNRNDSIIRYNTFVWRFGAYRVNWVNYKRGVRHYNNTIINAGPRAIRRGKPKRVFIPISVY